MQAAEGSEMGSLGAARRAVLAGAAVAATALIHGACLSPTSIKLEISTDSCQDFTGARISAGAPGPTDPTGKPVSTTACSNGTVGDLVAVPSGAGNGVAVVVVGAIGAPLSACTAPDYGKGNPDKSKGCVVARRRLAYVPHRPLRLPIVLSRGCIGVPCGVDQTCDNGRCISSEVDPNTCDLPSGCQPGDGGAPDAGPVDAGQDAPAVGAVAVASGGMHACAILADGTVRCWGANTHGQLGNGSTTDSATPVAVQGLVAPATAIALGAEHSCAIVSTMGGKVQCWGGNASGQLGDGKAPVDQPTATVAQISGVTAVAAGGQHSCATTSLGQLACWGANTFAQLGNGTTAVLPGVQMLNLSSANAVSAGTNHTCAIAMGGLWCWGAGADGQLGAANPPWSAPVSVLSSPVSSPAAGGAHSCVLYGNPARCWGSNTHGQLGDGTTTSRPTTNVGVQTLQVVSAIAAGLEHTCALADGKAWCWGRNDSGQVGDPGSTDVLSPKAVPLAITPSAIAPGGAHTCALVGSAVWCWGSNARGQLGRSAPPTSAAPLPVSGL
jgi:alpha-tubulin suppressor-like RCC1 family protein